MPTEIKSTVRFENEYRRLVRKYPTLRDEIHRLSSQVAQDDRPGLAIPHVEHDVYKVRLPNGSARRGKSGGFRVIYFQRQETLVFLLVVYSKTEHADIPSDVLRRLIAELD